MSVEFYSNEEEFSLVVFKVNRCIAFKEVFQAKILAESI